MQNDQSNSLSEGQAYLTKLPKKSPCKRKKSKQKRNWIIDLRRTHYKILKQVAQNDLGWKVLKEGSEAEPNLIWSDFYVSQDEVNNLLSFQKINHFPSSFQLGSKTFLTKNISRMRKKYPRQYEFLPQSWQLPDELELFKRHKEKKKGGVWILKPANLCQGKGITITGSVELIEQKTKQSKKQFVLQRYIQVPYLIEGLKFDLRLYVLVRSLKPLEIYLYRDGLARFATSIYKKPSRSNVTDSFMHLTNYAVNKKNPIFCDEEETGHKRRFSSILEILAKEGKDTDNLMRKIVKAVVCTIISVQPKLSHLYASSAPSKFARGKNCFEIFGFDFLLNQHLDPFLLEVNHTPSFRISSETDKTIKRSLLKNTLQQLFHKPENEVWHQQYQWKSKDSLQYLQIYPTKDEIDPYSEIIDYSQMLFDCWTGVRKDKPQKDRNHQYRTQTQPQSPQPKRSSSVSKPSKHFYRPYTANSETSPKNKSLRKTMTSFDTTQFQFQTVKIIPNRLAKPFEKRTMSAAAKKHYQLGSSKQMITGEEKKLACIVYDFVERNIDVGIPLELTSKENSSLTTTKTKKILLKSFNSKQYKNVRSKVFYENHYKVKEEEQE